MFNSNTTKAAFEAYNRDQKEEALSLYYASPNFCRFCHKVIRVGKEQPAETRRKKYCDSSCSAKMNNQLFVKRSRKIKTCSRCNEQILSQSKGKICSRCLYFVSSKGKKLLKHQTKKELFETAKNWQSARSMIVAHAKNTYIKSKKPLKCAACGYNVHIEIAHKKPVSDFSDTSTVGEINAPENLVALCRTHHFEQENEILILPDDETGDETGNWII